MKLILCLCRRESQHAEYYAGYARGVGVVQGGSGAQYRAIQTERD